MENIIRDAEAWREIGSSTVSAFKGRKKKKKQIFQRKKKLLGLFFTVSGLLRGFQLIGIYSVWIF